MWCRAAPTATPSPSQEVGSFFDRHLRGRPPLPTLAAPFWTTDGALCCEVLPPVPLFRPRLVLTQDRGRWQNRTWIEAQACRDEAIIIGEAPADACAAILMVEDDHGALVSTTVQQRAVTDPSKPPLA